MNDSRRKHAGIYLFLIIYCVWLFFLSLNKLTLFSTYIDGNFTVSIRIVCLFLLIVDEIIMGERYGGKAFCGVLIVGISILIAMTSKNYYIIDIMSFMFVSRNVPFKLIAKCSFFIQLVVMLSTIYGMKIGILVNRTYYRNNGTLRNSLGYNYTSYIAQVFMYMCLSLVAWRKEKINILSLLVLFIVNYYIYKLTATRNPFYLTTLLLLYLLVDKFMDVNFLKVKWASFLTMISIPFAAIVSIYFGYTFKYTSFYSMLNWVLSSRLSLGNKAIQMYGLKWLGQPIEFVGGGDMAGAIQGYNYVDNGYLQMAILDGIIFSIIILILFFLCSKWIVRNKNRFYAVCIIVIAVHSMVDPQFIYLWVSPFILLCSSVFNEQNDLENML